MKYIFLFVIIFPFIAVAQDSTVSLSKYEKFSSANGKMFKTETKSIGKIRDITISRVKTTNVETGESISAIQIFQKNIVMFTPISLGVLYIDIDELDGVVKSLEYYQAEIKKGKPNFQPSFNYVTSNDIQVNCSYLEGSFGGWYVNLSQRYHYLKTTISGSIITIKNKDIDDLADIISNSKEAKF